MHGRIEFGDRTIELADITVPVLVFGGATDGIAPIPAVKAVVPLLTGAAEVRFEIVPGGHLGMLTGRAARDTTWRVLDEWIGAVVAVEDSPAKPTRAKKARPSGTRSARTPSGGTARPGTGAGPLTAPS